MEQVSERYSFSNVPEAEEALERSSFRGHVAESDGQSVKLDVSIQVMLLGCK